MYIGIPKESWSDEKRVALTPAGAYALTQLGHSVYVHADAGLGCGFQAEEYRQAGATIAFSAEEVFARADLLVKVMPPTLEECGWIPEQKVIFSTVHLGTADPRVH
jgi:alanine dehydrogenase